MLRRIDSALISEKNEELYSNLKTDYDALAEKLARDGIVIYRRLCALARVMLCYEQKR